MLWLCHLVASFLWGDEIWFWLSKLLNIGILNFNKALPIAETFFTSGKIALKLLTLLGLKSLRRGVKSFVYDLFDF